MATTRTRHGAPSQPETEELTDPSALAELEANSFNAIFEQYGRQRAVQANEDVPAGDGARELNLSDYGFSALPLADGARFVRLSSPHIQTTERTAATLENQLVDQMIVHAVGWSYDKPNLENRRAGSPIEEGTRYNPAKVATVIQEYLSGRRKAPHCLISRRGDIYCFIPWSKASALSVPTGNTADIQDRSISVAFEALYTTQVVAYSPRDESLPIAMIEPVTSSQIGALSFLALKLMSMAGITELPVLDGTLAQLTPKLGTGGSHTPGILSYGAIDYSMSAEMLPEFLLPEDWVVGSVSTLPARLKRSAVLRAWTTRIQRAYPLFGFTRGFPVSDWPRLTSRISQANVFAYETELFTPPAPARVFEAQPPQGVVAASSSRARIVTGEAYQRAYDMSSATRSSLYDAASVALDATVIAAMEKEARNRSVEDGVTHVAIAQSALGFDFNDGLWKYLDVPVSPAPGTITIEGRAVPAPAGSRPAANDR